MGLPCSLSDPPPPSFNVHTQHTHTHAHSLTHFCPPTRTEPHSGRRTELLPCTDVASELGVAWNEGMLSSVGSPLLSSLAALPRCRPPSSPLWMLFVPGVLLSLSSLLLAAHTHTINTRLCVLFLSVYKSPVVPLWSSGGPEVWRRRRRESGQQVSPKTAACHRRLWNLWTLWIKNLVRSWLVSYHFHVSPLFKFPLKVVTWLTSQLTN